MDNTPQGPPPDEHEEDPAPPFSQRRLDQLLAILDRTEAKRAAERAAAQQNPDQKRQEP